MVGTATSSRWRQRSAASNLVDQGCRNPTKDHPERLYGSGLTLRPIQARVVVVLAILAPGQGAQRQGFLSPWLSLAGAAEHLDRLSDAAGIDLVAAGTT